MAFVLDASVALAWSFADEQSAAARRALRRLEEERGLAPTIWALEVTNGFLMAERSGRVDEADVVQMCEDLAGLPIDLADVTVDYALGPVLELARVHRLTTYDACYLELARHHVLPLATLDGNLRAAADQIGVALVD